MDIQKESQLQNEIVDYTTTCIDIPYISAPMRERFGSCDDITPSVVSRLSPAPVCHLVALQYLSISLFTCPPIRNYGFWARAHSMQIPPMPRF